MWSSIFFFQAEDGIRDLVRSRGLGDVYKRQKLSLKIKLSLNKNSETNQRSVSLLARQRPYSIKRLSLIHI